MWSQASRAQSGHCGEYISAVKMKRRLMVLDAGTARYWGAGRGGGRGLVFVGPATWAAVMGSMH